MPGLLIIAHAPLASSFREVARHAFPDSVVRLEALDVTADMSLEEIEAAARVLLATVVTPDALILTDVAGATPCNVAIRLASRFDSASQVKVISGLNVPMLWRVISHANDSIEQLLAGALTVGSAGVATQSNTKPQNQAQRTGANDQDARQHNQ